jgi:hypothetical protein
MSNKAMSNKAMATKLAAALLGLLTTTGAWAADPVGEPGRESKKANPLKNVYFGEQHLHTSNSPDAFAAGSRQSWDDTFRYGRGDEVKLNTITTNNTIKKSTPYDFMAITDHAEYFGVMPRMIDPKDPLSKSALAKRLQKNDQTAVMDILKDILTSTGRPEFTDPKLVRDNWDNYVKVANKYNDPGKFTTLIAFEWTSIPGGRNMHRNVFFRNDTGPRAPYSSFNSIYPEDLWTYLEVQRNAGADTFAIPHNGNVSDGWMYSPYKFLGDLMDARYAERQQLNEPLTEIIQTKGSSDAHPAFSPNDEFANFELFPNLINIGEPSQINHGYIRYALVDGMILENRLGANPFKYGIVSGADSHSGYSNNEEFNFHGSHGALEDTPKKRLNPVMNASGEMPSILGSAGATAVWAEENTRGAIFDAMKAKETYGTSGTLIRLRFFGGWDYDDGLIEDKNFVKKAYEDGVPMGQDLPKKNGKAPTFAVWALKDPESGNLDRIQIIKGFINKWGRPAEKIFVVAWSDNRSLDP